MAESRRHDRAGPRTPIWAAQESRGSAVRVVLAAEHRGTDREVRAPPHRYEVTNICRGWKRGSSSREGAQ